MALRTENWTASPFLFFCWQGWLRHFDGPNSLFQGCCKGRRVFCLQGSKFSTPVPLPHPWWPSIFTQPPHAMLLLILLRTVTAFFCPCGLWRLDEGSCSSQSVEYFCPSHVSGSFHSLYTWLCCELLRCSLWRFGPLVCGALFPLHVAVSEVGVRPALSFWFYILVYFDLL